MLTQRILFGLIWTSAVLAAQPALPDAEAGSCQIVWTDEAAVIDGKPDDRSWASAPTLSDFVPLGTPDTESRTEVRMMYDAANLYCFWKVYEKNRSIGRGEVPKGGPGDRGDVVEIELHPYAKENQWILFGGTAHGERYEVISNEEGASRRWKGMAGTFDGGWTFEACIPFESLVGVDQILGTPQKGERWRVQLYRKSNQATEVAVWKPASAAGGVPDCQFGGLTGGNGETQKLHVAVEFPLSLRSGAVKFVVENNFSSLQASSAIFQDGAAFEKTEGTLAGATEKDVQDAVARATAVTQSLELPFHLSRTGLVKFRFDLHRGDAHLFRGWAVSEIPSERSLIPDTSSLSKELRLRLKDSKDPEVKLVHDRLEELERQIESVRVKLDTELLPQDQKEVAELCKTFPPRWKALQFDLHLADWRTSGTGVADAPFVLGNVAGDEKIYPDTVYQGPTDVPIKMALAGNETGSAQVVVIPFWRDLPEVTVELGALKGADGKDLPADIVRFFEVRYVELEEPPAWAKASYQHRIEPDPLVPLKSFAVAAGRVGVIWMDVDMPPGQEAGIYRGTLTVRSGDLAVSKAVEIESRGFDLPKRGTLKTDFWFVPHLNWKPHYGEFRYTPALHAKHAETLGRYRVGSFPVDWTAICPQVAITREPDGTFTFDWSVFDQFIHNAREQQSTAYWSALSSCAGWTMYLNIPETPFTDRATGRTMRIKDVMGEIWRESGENDDNSRMYGTSFRKNPIYRQFLSAYANHLEQLGIADRSYYEQFDEANQDRPPHNLWHWMISHHQFFREVAPNLQLLNFGLHPLQEIDGKKATGLIDAWAPHLFELDDPDVVQAIQQRREQEGEEFWAYTCIQKTREDGKKTPYIYYHEPYIGIRMHFWMAWKYQLDGLLIYSLNRVPATNLKKAPDKRWPHGMWSDGGQMGEGVLIYPGENFEIIPSIRLAQIRQGLEDYEYFALLQNEWKGLDPERDRDLIAEVKRALVLDDGIVSSVYDWTADARKLDRKRDEIAALIRQVQAAKLRSGTALPERDAQ